MEYKKEYELLQDEVNSALQNCFRTDDTPLLWEAMRYSLLAGGKRIRPILLLKFCEACGGTKASALSAACGIEMLHTYSLIHDDLPCMDDDDLRRGRPTCHKAYGETTAVLAGDALQAAAFHAVLTSAAAPERTAAMALTLADAAGERGMCLGQYYDTCRENPQITEQELYETHRLKTGALLRAACVMGVQCAGGNDEQLGAAEKFAENLGLAFQIRDDVLDCISTEEELGKPIGSDEQEGETTFATLFGTEACAQLVHRHTQAAIDALEGHFADTGFLCWLAEQLADRRK